MHFLCYRGKKGGLTPVYTDAIEKTCQDHGESSLKVPCIMCAKAGNAFARRTSAAWFDGNAFLKLSEF